MSFDPLIQAMQDNPELVEELNAAKTPRERDAVLDAHGIEKPTMDSEFPDPAAGNSGGGPPSSGRLSSRMFIFENTAVKIRKKIMMIITSSIGTMLMSFLPR